MVGHVDKNQGGVQMSTHVIVFSKDRAAQLDLCLTTFFRYNLNFNGHITVIYTHSDDDFKKGYDILKQDIGNVNFVREHNFKSDLISVVKMYTDKHIMFLVDDDIFLRQFDFDDVADEMMNDDICCFSLRLGERIDKNYEKGNITKPPHVMRTDNVITWAWRGADTDWGYPMSVDGHVFRSSDIVGRVEKLGYDHACNFESFLKDDPIDRPFMRSFREPVLVGCPLNRVQNIFVHNKYGNITAKELNDKYLMHYVIDDNELKFADLSAVHSEIDGAIKWKVQ